jgi:hypothetical protein
VQPYARLTVCNHFNHVTVTVATQQVCNHYRNYVVKPENKVSETCYEW